MALKPEKILTSSSFTRNLARILSKPLMAKFKTKQTEACFTKTEEGGSKGINCSTAACFAEREGKYPVGEYIP